jgi:hypothetical protein
MLAHCRRDGNAFCDHESHRVDGDRDRSRIEARSRILDNCHSIVFAFATGHGDSRILFVSTARRRRGRRGDDVGVVKVVGIRSMLRMSSSASSGKIVHPFKGELQGCLYGKGIE